MIARRPFIIKLKAGRLKAVVLNPALRKEKRHCRFQTPAGFETA
jgi:hypothetical protein